MYLICRNGCTDLALHRVYVKTFGCSTNFADGEVIAGCLSDAGYEIVDSPENADVLIYNTCAVKTPTENKMFTILKKTLKDRKLIVAGCLPLINFERLKREIKFDGVIGPAPGLEIVKVVNDVVQGKNVVLLEKGFKPSLSLPRIASSSVVKIIPISYGCTSSCSYCCVRFARGPLRSYSLDEVLDQVRQALSRGASEIWLTAQDSACYGRDIGTNLAALLKRVVELDGEFFVRVGMMNPSYVPDKMRELVDVYKSEKIFKFLHLPLQSGDDEVLKLMNRSYSVQIFKSIVSIFRNEIPQLTVSTDIICGFPGESDQAFEKSLRLVEEVEPDIVNVSRFFPRPGTPVEKIRGVPGCKIKERSEKMAEAARKISLKRNKAWLGWKGEVLIDEKGKGNSWVGRNFAYKPIVVRSENNMLGRRLFLHVKNAFPTYLEAEKI